MSFASPWMLWGLLSLIPLVALYFLKVRPARKPVTAWFLWEKVFAERRARSLFQKFRDLLSLLLLAGLFAAAVLAAARPSWSGDSRRDLVLVLDHSASMNADDGGMSRLERARRTASSIVRSLNGSQRCCIASLADRLVVHSGLTDNPRELLDAIDRIRPTTLPSTRQGVELLEQMDLAAASGAGLPNGSVPPSPAPAGAARADAAAPSGGARQPRVILISDGCLGTGLPTGIELLKTGSGPRGNAGLVACDLQRLPLEGSPAGVFFQVASSFGEPQKLDLEICHDSPDRPVRVIPLEVKPGLNPPETIRLENAPEGKWFFRIVSADALPDDNLVPAVLPPVVPVDVSVLAEGRFFYETSIEAFSQGNQLLRLVQPAEGAVVVCQGNVDVTGVPPEAGLLVFQPSGESEWWQAVGEGILVAAPAVKAPDHPLLRYLDGHSLPWSGARRLTAPPGAEILVAGDDGTPLLYRLVSRGRSAIIVNLDPVAAGFFLSPHFPVLVHTAATQLGGRSVLEPAVCATGQGLELPDAADAGPTTWQLPDGTSQSVVDGSTGPLQQTGFHSFTTRGRNWSTGCGLLAPAETLLDNAAITDTSQPVARGWLPAGLLTILAVALLVTESVLFHRRLAG